MVAPIDPRCVSDANGGADGDHGIARIASRQHGLITTRQLKALGFGDTTVYRRVRRGALHRVHRGIYRVGHISPEPRSDLLAAVMASGPSAALSHRAAAQLWGLVPDHGPSIDVTTRRNLRQRAGIRLHRFSALGRPDLRGRERIPLTSPALTVLDLAAGAGPDAAQAALDEARFRRLLVTGDLEQLRRRHPRRAGWIALGSLLDAEREPGFSRSEAERLLLRMIRDAGLPEPQRNHRIHGYELDLFWPEHRLAVEIDGYRSHGRRGSFERDRARDADLGAHGISVRRFTWHQITRRRLWLVARLAAAVSPR